MKNLQQIFDQNLRGQEYIKARGLEPKPLYEHQCPHCKRIELEKKIIQLTKNWRLS